MPDYTTRRIDSATDNPAAENWQFQWNDDRFHLKDSAGSTVIDCPANDVIKKVNLYSLSKNSFTLRIDFGDYRQFETTPELLRDVRALVKAGMRAHPRFFLGRQS